MTLEALKAPRTGQGPIQELFWLDLAWFFIVFETISAYTLAVAKVWLHGFTEAVRTQKVVVAPWAQL